MVTRLSKILVVFVTTASIAFMGFALAVSNAGPNWSAQANELEDYIFTLAPKTETQPATWSVQQRTATDQIGSSPVLPKLIGQALDDGKRRNDEELAEIEPKIPPLEQQIAAMEQVISIDKTGLDNRDKQLLAAYKQLETDIQQVALAGDRLAQEAIRVRTMAELRRESVFRLLRELEQIETDHFQLGEQKRRLLDLLFQTEGLRIRLRDREKQLIAQGANVPPPAVTSNSAVKVSDTAAD